MIKLESELNTLKIELVPELAPRRKLTLLVARVTLTSTQMIMAKRALLKIIGPATTSTYKGRGVVRLGYTA